MRPRESYHSVTNLYRQPGGLSELDYLIAKLNTHQQSLKQDVYKIALIGDKNSAFAIPLALQGIEVVSFFASETAMVKANEFAEEIGVFLVNKLGDTVDHADKFDAIISLQKDAELVDISERAEQYKRKLNSNGRLFFSLSKATVTKKSRSYKKIIKNFTDANLLPVDCRPTSLLLHSFYDSSKRSKIKRGSQSFHLLDYLDSKLAALFPRPLSSTWLYECIPGSNQKLAIQLVTTLSAGGGAERLAVQLADKIPEYGYSSLVVAMVRGGQLDAVLREKNIPYIIFERRNWLDRFLIPVKLTRLFADLAPVIVNTHLFAADFWGRLATKFSGVVTITTVHNVKTQFGKLGELIMRIMSGFSVKYIAISEDVKNYLIQNLKIKAVKITNINNGIDLDGIRIRTNHQMHDVPKLIFVGRLEQQKAPLVLIQALAKVNGPWELNIFGSGSLEAEMRRLSDDLNLSSRIRFMGVTKDIYQRYCEYDLFILPSLWEGFGLAAIEAAAAHLPMIVSDLPVMHELFNDNEVVFTPPNDIDKLAESIQRLLSHPELTSKLSQQLTKRDFSGYSLSRMVKGYADVYQSCVKK